MSEMSYPHAPLRDSLDYQEAPSRPTTQESSNLTPNELIHLDLLAAGLTGEEAAQEAFVSAATVRSHRQSTMNKLGGKNAAHVVALAFTQGILPLMIRRD
jgi:DNA-binding NarL/FixJ family response regulator